MIGKYPIVERAERTALARAVARARRMHEAITDRSRLDAEISTSRVGNPPARAGVEISAARSTVRGTTPPTVRGTTAPDPGSGERGTTKSVVPAAEISRVEACS